MKHTILIITNFTVSRILVYTSTIVILRLCVNYCLQAALAFEEGLSELLGWIEAQRETLDNMTPPDEDANVLQEQIEENKV